MNLTSRGTAAARIGLPLLLVGAVLTMVVPLPPVLLDLLLAINITLAVVVTMAVLTMRDTLELSSFPSLLLMATLLRLAINVSSTRLILLNGYAGKVIETFGNFVVGGSVVVGLVVFLILIVIQFVVVTNGAGRVAEVAARFSLDAMPGKQMAIDADLAAGLIDEQQARERRKRIAKESDFHGAMDGASKFVKGDAIAGIIIVVINLVGGFAIGVAGAGLSMAEAINTYALLTVGDGLVSQIPALLLSVSTGLLVARVGDDDDLGPLLRTQLLGRSQATRIAGVVVLAMMLVPGLPKLPFLLLGGALLAMSTRTSGDDTGGADADADQATVAASPDDPEALIGAMRVEPLELLLAYDILDLIDPDNGGDLLERVRSLRRQIATDLGVVMPLVRTRDDVTVPPGTYRILVHGVPVADGVAPRDRLLALPAGDGSELGAMRGDATVEPVFGLTAYWIPDEGREQAAAVGSTVVDRSSVIVTHLAEVVRGEAGSLLTRQQVQQLVEGLRYDEPLLANEVGSETLPIALLHDVLRGLLDDRVAIRDLGRIVDAVATTARSTQSVPALVAAARVALGGAIVARLAPDHRLDALTLDPALEAGLHEALRDVDGTLHLVTEPQRVSAIVSQVQAAQTASGAQGSPLALVCGQMLRRPLHQMLQASGADVDVLAYTELPPHVQVTPIGAIHDVTVDA